MMSDTYALTIVVNASRKLVHCFLGIVLIRPNGKEFDPLDEVLAGRKYPSMLHSLSEEKKLLRCLTHSFFFSNI